MKGAVGRVKECALRFDWSRAPKWYSCDPIPWMEGNAIRDMYVFSGITYAPSGLHAYNGYPFFTCCLGWNSMD